MQISDVEGTHLDYWVYRAEGGQETFPEFYEKKYPEGRFAFSSDWSVGGPVIDRERIATWGGPGMDWFALHPSHFPTAYDGEHGYIDVEDGDCQTGSNLLVAAMRAYVVSKFGDTLPEIP